MGVEGESRSHVTVDKLREWRQAHLEAVDNSPRIEEDAFARILVCPRQNIIGRGAAHLGVWGIWQSRCGLHG